MLHLTERLERVEHDQDNMNISLLSDAPRMHGNFSCALCLGWASSTLGNFECFEPTTAPGLELPFVLRLGSAACMLFAHSLLPLLLCFICFCNV